MKLKLRIINNTKFAVHVYTNGIYNGIIASQSSIISSKVIWFIHRMDKK